MDQPRMNQSPGAGPTYWVFGGQFTFLVTGDDTDGRYATIEMRIPPQRGPQPHIHHETHEQFYILAGDVTFTLGDQTIHAAPGDSVLIPPGTPHAFKAGAEPARLLAILAPAGVEKFFQEVGYPVTDRLNAPPPPTPETLARARAAEARYDHETVLPPPSERG